MNPQSTWHLAHNLARYGRGEVRIYRTTTGRGRLLSRKHTLRIIKAVCRRITEPGPLCIDGRAYRARTRARRRRRRP